MESTDKSVGPEQSSQSDDGSVTSLSGTLSKNKIRKIRKYVKKCETRKAKRLEEKKTRKMHRQEQGVVSHRKFRGNEEKCQAAERLQKAMQTGAKVVIDCQYVSKMSLKEQKRFAQQIRRAYSSNRVAESPLHLYLASLSENCDFFEICCQQNAGFASYVLDRTDKSVLELFGGGDSNDTPEQVIYLSPDSENVLTEFDPDRVYIIGGIVDETTSKNISKRFAEGKKISTARIPIDKYFTRSETGTFKQVLTINQVVDIILEWHRSKDWVKAISAGLPQRTGFVPLEH